MVTIRGPIVSEDSDINLDDVRIVSIAAKGIGVWNAGFDITPASLITAIITEKGVIAKEDGQNEYDLSKI